MKKLLAALLILSVAFGAFAGGGKDKAAGGEKFTLSISHIVN
jgi:hypothetical protein